MRTLSLSLISLLFTLPAWAADMENGKQLHAENCVRCHDSSVYTRDPRRVNSLPELGKQVRFCKDNIGLTWFDDEVDDVIYYLNQKYYHF
jgi:hypothetical protein